MRDGLSLAALGATGMALLFVLFTPAGGPLQARASTSSERAALKVFAEADAAAEDRAVLAAIDSDVGILRRKLAEVESPGSEDGSALVREVIEKELEKRSREFAASIDSIRAAEKRAPKPKE